MGSLIGIIAVLLLIWILPVIVAVSISSGRSDDLARRLDKLEGKIRELSLAQEKTPSVSSVKDVPAVSEESAVPAIPHPKRTPPPLSAEMSPSVVPAEPSTPFVENLREWKILPPRDMSIETVVMQWWAPRVGGLLALLALIFFGVWASKFASALVKILEMAAVAVAVTGGGVFFKKRGNLSLGDPMTATGTTMFYLVALAAGTFPPTKIFDSIPFALGVQILAILPTLWLGRGKQIPMHLGLAFAFVSAMFAVLNGAGTAALVTALLAYGVAALFSAKKNELGLLLTGTLGAYLPLWAINLPFPRSEIIRLDCMSVGFDSLFQYPEFLICVAFFVVAVSFVPAVLLKKSETNLTRFLQAGNFLHAAAALCWVSQVFAKKFPAKFVGDLRADFFADAVFFSAVAATSLVWAAIYRLSQRRTSFPFQFFTVAGALALPAAVYFWGGANFGDALHLLLLIETILLAVLMRATNAKALLLPVTVCLLLAFLRNSAQAVNPTTDLLNAVTLLFAAAWIFGKKSQWDNEPLCYAKILGGALAGIFGGIKLWALRDSFFAVSPTTEIIVPAVLCAAVAACAFLPRFTKIPFLFAAGTFSTCAYFIGFNELFAPKNFTAGQTWICGIVLTAIAVPALRVFVKDKLTGKIAEVCFWVPALVFLVKFFSDDATLNPISGACVVFGLPVLLLLLGTVWKKDYPAFPLSRGATELWAIPLALAFFDFPWKAFAGNYIPAAIIAFCIFVPFVISPMRKMLRDSIWRAVSLTTTGTACLLVWGYETFPRFLTAEAATLAIGLIFAGLAARIRSVRIVGIVFLAGTLVRLSVFDIGETVWRIVAFALVSATLFLLGFVYHRFSKNRKSSETE
ncbi:MAG: hypothetical protein IJN19_02710 [Opitutales bacterium]|nr:hypothetical protein [Opitutales bacterium]